MKLIQELKEAVATEREATTRVLRLLRQVEDTETYLKAGYPSMFVFCQKELGFSEGETHTRLQNMRLIRDVPAVEEKLETGEISPSVAAKVQGCIKREGVEDKEAFVEQFVGTSVREAEKKIAEMFPEEPKKEKAKPVNQELTRVEFNATKEMMAKLERLKELMAHKNFAGRWDELFDQLADLGLKKWEKVADAPFLETPQVTAQQTHARYIPVEVQRFIYTRDKGECQYKAANGQRCGYRHGVQVDHIKPFALGRGNEPENLRLLCGKHNRMRNRGAG